jgi:hypothetical protein
MRLPIKTINEIETPLSGFGFAFIDAEDKKLKVRKHDSLIEFTNELSDIQLLNLCDYTAFEVFAHDYDIPSGYCIELSGDVTNPIPACMTHKFGIRSQESPEKQNVIVDWGDGNITKLSKLTPSNGYYYVSHEYNSNGKYIVKIFGNTYFAIAQSAAFAYTEPNILCRVFDVDLPIASHLGNLSSFCINSNHLINVKVPAAFNWSNVKNLSSTFWECKNLLSVTGLPICNKFNFQESGIFRGCINLKETDFSFIHVSYGGWSRAFYDCKNLELDINDLFYYPFSTKGEKIDITSCFHNCVKLSGDVPAEKLWDNKEVIWTWGKDSKGNPYYPFTGCSKEILDQVPVSWGGNALNENIEN